jgi:hypothetical protein
METIQPHEAASGVADSGIRLRGQQQELSGSADQEIIRKSLPARRTKHIVLARIG